MNNIEHLPNPYSHDVWLAEEFIPIFQGYQNDDPSFMPGITRDPRPAPTPETHRLLVFIQDPDKTGVHESHDSALAYLTKHAPAIEAAALELLMRHFAECQELIDAGMEGLDPILRSAMPHPKGVEELVNHVDPPAIVLGSEPGVIVLRFTTSWEDEHGVSITVFAEAAPRLEPGDYWEDPQ